jgi:hypothetical protein
MGEPWENAAVLTSTDGGRSRIHEAPKKLPPTCRCSMEKVRLPEIRALVRERRIPEKIS